ncbi:MAG: HNH endonuclease [Chloroflexota bacterium]|nr:HNH endonuclease [Chloroflexota bacterium]
MSELAELIRAIPSSQLSRELQTREPIPEEVRHEVWRRDQGKCVRCGGVERLEFDHIVPVALGGSNTTRNVQLLCETCNREKGVRI